MESKGNNIEQLVSDRVVYHEMDKIIGYLSLQTEEKKRKKESISGIVSIKSAILMWKEYMEDKKYGDINFSEFSLKEPKAYSLVIESLSESVDKYGYLLNNNS